jgi:hypothetical protein
LFGNLNNAYITRSDVKEQSVVPDIKKITSEKKPIPGGQAEKVSNLRILFIQMARMKWNEEVWCVREIFSAPYIPAACFTRDWMSKTIDWSQTLR